MAINRLIQTRIWTDEWFRTRTEYAQRLYLFLLTNRSTSISGHYEMTVAEISFHLRWTEEKTKKHLQELHPKIIYFKSWIYIDKYPEYQNVANNEKVQVAIEKDLKAVPPEVINHKSEIINHKSEAIDKASIAYASPPETPKNKDKEVYGENSKVLLTIVEYQKICELLGEQNTKNLIEELDDYIASTGKKYASHYATLRTWARRKVNDYRRDKTNTKKKII